MAHVGSAAVELVKVGLYIVGPDQASSEANSSCHTHGEESRVQVSPEHLLCERLAMNRHYLGLYIQNFTLFQSCEI